MLLPPSPVALDRFRRQGPSSASVATRGLSTDRVGGPVRNDQSTAGRLGTERFRGDNDTFSQQRGSRRSSRTAVPARPINASCRRLETSRQGIQPANTVCHQSSNHLMANLSRRVKASTAVLLGETFNSRTYSPTARSTGNCWTIPPAMPNRDNGICSDR